MTENAFACVRRIYGLKLTRRKENRIKKNKSVSLSSKVVEMVGNSHGK